MTHSLSDKDENSIKSFVPLIMEFGCNLFDPHCIPPWSNIDQIRALKSDYKVNLTKLEETVWVSQCKKSCYDLKSMDFQVICSQNQVGIKPDKWQWVQISFILPTSILIFYCRYDNDTKQWSVFAVIFLQNTILNEQNCFADKLCHSAIDKDVIECPVQKYNDKLIFQIIDNMITLIILNKWTKFWIEQLNGMMSTEHHQKQITPFKVERSLMVAVSSLSYLAPTIWMIIFIQRSTIWIDAIIYVTMSIISLCGDFVYVDNNTNNRITHKMHLLDQWTSTSAVALNFYKCYIYFNGLLDLICIIGLSLPAFKLLKQSRESATFNKWIFWHSIWHFYGAFICFYVGFKEKYPTDLAVTHIYQSLFSPS